MPSLQGVVEAFIAFFLMCCCIGRPDIPMRLVTELRTKAIKGTHASWGCPSVFNRDACHTYDPNRYRK